MAAATFATGSDYLVPLLRLLAVQPDGACARRDAIALFFDQYGDRLPADDLRTIASTGNTTLWQHKLSGAAAYLIQCQLMEKHPGDLWALTDWGRSWVESHPDAQRLDESAKAHYRVGGSSERSAQPSRRGGSQMTLEAMDEIRQSMDPEQFRRRWGELYDQLLAQERVRATTELSDRDLLRAVQAPVKMIHRYLNGSLDRQPAAEELCDWILFCYQLGLERDSGTLAPSTARECQRLVSRPDAKDCEGL